ncbi:Scr1 family TA system antitoxin-like transcriptional regulator [Streptomyces cacaoi]|uniref:Scr1 family TA system antitoxin-like transcriptional regulator n=1 Tax=Streptomyces cacaoi TaxID=1898 RepID=UPI003CC81B70
MTAGVPYAAGPTPSAVPYTLLRTDGGRWTVHSEFPFGGRAYDTPEYVSECMDMYDLLKARALSPDDSVSYVREISREVYQ